MDEELEDSSHLDDSSDEDELYQEVELLKRHVANNEFYGNDCAEKSLNVVPSVSEILEIPVETILATPANILALNYAAQRVLLNLKRNVLKNLEKNREEQVEIEDYLDRSKKGMKNKQDNAISFFSICGMPFFKISDGRSQPDNAYVRLKERYGEISAREYVEPPLYWSASAISNLKQVVMNNAMEMELNKLEDDTREMLKQGNVEGIERKQKEIHRIRKEKAVAVDSKNLDWLRVSATLSPLFLFSPSECEARWRLTLDHRLNTSPWTVNEVDSLCELAKKYYFQNWEKIAQELGNDRSTLNCYLKYNECIVKRTKTTWEPEEDKRLESLVEKFSCGNHINWPKIYYYFDHRSHVQLRTHYHFVIKSKTKGRFTKEEDEILLNVFEPCSKNMHMAKKLLPDRSVPQIHRRYMRLICDKPTFTPDEDRLLLDAVSVHGRDWQVIAEAVPGRQPIEVQRRFKVLHELTQDIFEKLGMQSSLKVEDLLASQHGCNTIWTLLQVFWQPGSIKPRISYGVPVDRRISIPMKELMQTLRFGYHLFGPRFGSPRSEEDKSIVSLRLATICEMLSVKCDFTTLKGSNLPPILERNGLLIDFLIDERFPSVPPIVDRSFLPPNHCTLLGHRVLLEAKSLLIAQADVSKTTLSTRNRHDQQREGFERISPATAKDLLRSRIFTLFFLPAIMGKIQTGTREIAYKTKGKKTAAVSKLKVRKKMKIMSEKRWKKFDEKLGREEVKPKPCKKRKTGTHPAFTSSKPKMIRVVATPGTKYKKSETFVIPLNPKVENEVKLEENEEKSVFLDLAQT